MHTSDGAVAAAVTPAREHAISDGGTGSAGEHEPVGHGEFLELKDGIHEPAVASIAAHLHSRLAHPSTPRPVSRSKLGPTALGSGWRLLKQL